MPRPAFHPRHIPPLLLATIWTLGGTMSLLSSPESALLTFGFAPHIASAEAAWPLIQVEGARITTIGLALWGMYLGGHLKALDILLAAVGWMAVVDGVVCGREGEVGSVGMRAGYQGVVAVWGVLGGTGGR
ncbi:hypothetical protein BDV95DRAFT_513976, partial [Massariosphaeria phaeospora]